MGGGGEGDAELGGEMRLMWVYVFVHLVVRNTQFSAVFSGLHSFFYIIVTWSMAALMFLHLC